MHQIVRKFARLTGAALAMVLALAGGIAIGGGGATGTGFIAQGSLTQFGSIFVNAIEFKTDKAAITINGSPNRSQSDLRIGMVLTVTGSVDGSGKTGNADTVTYVADAVGLIDQAPAADGTFVVLGQSIHSQPTTVFAGFIALSELHAGDYVEVSGFRTADGGLLASRIERKTSVATVQVQGTISGTTSSTFAIGTLTVDYTVATLKDVPAGGLVDGLTVVAKGPTPVNGVLQASEVDVVNQSLSGNRNGSLSGSVDSTAAGSFVLNGQTIFTTSNTQYVNGAAADLAAGSFVKADVLISGSTIVATKIEYTVLNAPADVDADVTATGTSSFELLGPGGVTITANAKTQWQDKSGANLNVLGFANMNVGDHVQVDGNQVRDTLLLATKIVRTRPSTAILVAGKAWSVAAPFVSILDLTIGTDAATTYTDELGNAMAPASFFATAAGHDIIVAARRAADGSLVASSMRLD
ncbi:MAG TPA: DUF5666 domain-containing protein [Usitatibacter sp.]|nr:DUF5666 domain-containing protein [Usitatibacter sp.]